MIMFQTEVTETKEVQTNLVKEKEQKVPNFNVRANPETFNFSKKSKTKEPTNLDKTSGDILAKVYRKAKNLEKDGKLRLGKVYDVTVNFKSNDQTIKSVPVKLYVKEENGKYKAVFESKLIQGGRYSAEIQKDDVKTPSGLSKLFSRKNANKFLGVAGVLGGIGAVVSRFSTVNTGVWHLVKWISWISALIFAVLYLVSMLRRVKGTNHRQSVELSVDFDAKGILKATKQLRKEAKESEKEKIFKQYGLKDKLKDGTTVDLDDYNLNNFAYNNMKLKKEGDKVYISYDGGEITYENNNILFEKILKDLYNKTKNLIEKAAALRNKKELSKELSVGDVTFFIDDGKVKYKFNGEEDYTLGTNNFLFVLSKIGGIGALKGISNQSNYPNNQRSPHLQKPNKSNSSIKKHKEKEVEEKNPSPQIRKKVVPPIHKKKITNEQLKQKYEQAYKIELAYGNLVNGFSSFAKDEIGGLNEVLIELDKNIFADQIAFDRIENWILGRGFITDTKYKEQVVARTAATFQYTALILQKKFRNELLKIMNDPSLSNEEKFDKISKLMDEQTKFLNELNKNLSHINKEWSENRILDSSDAENYARIGGSLLLLAAQFVFRGEIASLEAKVTQTGEKLVGKILRRKATKVVEKKVLEEAGEEGSKFVEKQALKETEKEVEKKEMKEIEKDVLKKEKSEIEPKELSENVNSEVKSKEKEIKSSNKENISKKTEPKKEVKEEIKKKSESKTKSEKVEESKDITKQGEKEVKEEIKNEETSTRNVEKQSKEKIKEKKKGRIRKVMGKVKEYKDISKEKGIKAVAKQAGKDFARGTWNFTKRQIKKIFIGLAGLSVISGVWWFVTEAKEPRGTRYESKNKTYKVVGKGISLDEAKGVFKEIISNEIEHEINDKDKRDALEKILNKHFSSEKEFNEYYNTFKEDIKHLKNLEFDKVKNKNLIKTIFDGLDDKSKTINGHTYKFNLKEKNANVVLIIEKVK